MFKDRLKQLRQMNNMTQDELANHLYVSRTLVAKWESGKRYPTDQCLSEIASLFDTSVEKLVEGDEEAIETGRELSECIPEGDNEGKDIEDEGDDVTLMLAKKVSDFLRALPKKERNIFLRRYYFYDSSEKIAKDNRMSVEDVRVITAEIRTKLMNYFMKEGM